MNQRSLKSTTACEFNVSSNSSNGVVQVESECPLLLGAQRDHLSVDHNHHYKTPQSSQHHHRNQYQSPNQISPSSSTLSSSNSSNSFSSSNSSSNSSLSSPPPSTQPPLLSANFHHSHQLYSNSHASLHQQSKYRLFSTQQPSQTPSHHHNKHQQQTHLPQQISQQQGKLNFQRSSFETISESFNRRLICFGYHQQPSPPPQHNHRHKHHFHHHLQHQNHHYLQQQNKAKCDHLHQVKSHGYPNNNTSSFKDDQEIIRSYIQPPPNKTVFNCCCDYLNCDSNSGKFS